MTFYAVSDTIEKMFVTERGLSMEDQSARIQSVKAQIQALETELFWLQQQQAQYETEQRRKQQKLRKQSSRSQEPIHRKLWMVWMQREEFRQQSLEKH